jgi:hypothetical protein
MNLLLRILGKTDIVDRILHALTLALEEPPLGPLALPHFSVHDFVGGEPWQAFLPKLVSRGHFFRSSSTCD